MRILNNATGEPLSRVTVYLTEAEIAELLDSVKNIIDNGSHHEHVSSGDHQKELTVCVYGTSNIESFDERSRRLIDMAV